MPELLTPQLEEYSQLCEQIKTLEARKEVIKKSLEAEFGQQERSLKTPLGTFKMVARTNYQFTEETVLAEEDLKIRKQDEIEQEIAKKTLVYGLRFNAAGEK